MIKRINILAVCSCLILLTACDRYLDIRPVGSVIPTTAAEYRALLAKAYQTVPRNRGLVSFRSDEMFISTNSDYDTNSFGDIECWNDGSPASGTVSFYWGDFYSALFTANYIIENQKAIVDGIGNEVAQLVGESYMLRAYMHFLLVDAYGQPYTKPGAVDTKAIPLKLNSDINEILFRNTVGEVYTSVLNDIDEAQKHINIERWDAKFAYRFNKVSVEAFRSRVLLYMGNWAESLKASEAALAQRNELEDLNLPEAKLPNHYQSAENIIALEETLPSSYQSAISATAVLLEKYTPGDLRLSLFYSAPDSKGNRKPLKGGKIDYRCSFRTGELYLNAAEAALMTGSNEAEAKKYLLHLMSKRYTPEAYIAKETAVKGMAKDALLNEIYNERTRELAFEGHRWFDLRRTTRPEITKVLKGKTYILQKDDARYTLPIPKEAIQSNPNLTN